jgi:two-component system sensor histidine kinase KdpD
MALLLVALTTALDRLVAPVLGEGALDLIYLLPVILVAARFGLRPGLFASIVAGLAYNFFFLAPHYTFNVADPESLLTILVLVAIAALTAQLTGRLRARATLSARSAAENTAVAGFAQALARASTRDETAATVCREVALLLDCDTLLLGDRAGELTVIGAHPEAATLGPVDHAAAEWCWTRGEPAGRSTATLNAADWQFHPLKTALGTLAVLGLARADGGDPVSADRSVLLATLIGQAALAHERLALERDMREVSMLKARDRLRGDLLSSIGRDLVSPLAAVSTAIEAMAAQAPDAPALPVARAEMQRLRRFLDNLVDMMRIDSGAVPLETEAVDLAEAVSAAVHDLRAMLAARPIALAMPPGLPRVRADPRLLHPILTNLLANAADHGGEGEIRVEAVRQPDAILLTIRDSGPGLDEEEGERLFQAFPQRGGDAEQADGGLGLAIVKGFADALGISVSAGPAPDGGAALTLRFGADAVISGG